MTPVTRVPPPQPAPRFRGAGLSHPGRLRGANEDAVLTDPTGALWAVADGMGGYGHGDLAADIVIEHLAALTHGGQASEVAAALRTANEAVRARARSEGVAVMGATVVAALLEGWRATILWAGDSRAYQLRGGMMSALTRDHSVVQELVDLGQLDPRRAQNHPSRHVVTRAVGAEPVLDVAAVETQLAGGDVLMLCSDGLSGCVPELEIAAILASTSDASDACTALVEAALQHGAPDNVSVVVVQADRSGAPTW